MENIGDEAEYVISNGLHGIKMHPDSQAFDIDDPRLFPMYEAISGKIPVMPHMGDPRYDFSHPRKLRRVMELFPNLQVIATHFGGYSMYEEAYDLLHDKDCVFDVSSSLMFMPEGVAEKYINAYGAERMAFGTDFPLWDPVVETERFMRLNLTADQFDQIGHKTAQRVLGL
jgi:predicted TIM-barrel fold metal-dependent hydrolase